MCEGGVVVLDDSALGNEGNCKVKAADWFVIPFPTPTPRRRGLQCAPCHTPSQDIRLRFAEHISSERLRHEGVEGDVSLMAHGRSL